MINSWADKDVSRVIVKLDNFGLARVYQHPLEYGLGKPCHHTRHRVACIL